MKFHRKSPRSRAAGHIARAQRDQTRACAPMNLLQKLRLVVAVLACAFVVSTCVRADAGVQMTQFTLDPTPPLPGPAPSPPPTTEPPRSRLSHDIGDEPAVGPAIEYSNLIRSGSATGSLDSGLLGESIDYYTGQTDFVATDVSLPLNFSLPMAVRRVYHVGNKSGGVLDGAFGDWDLDIPHIEGVLATSVGWTVSGSGAYNECSDFGPPLAATVTTATASGDVTTTIPASEYSQGFSVVVPGKGRHEMLLRASTNTVAPVGDYADYPVVTHDWWAATCKPIYGYRTGQPSQRFLVTSPDGVTYDFGYYSSRPYPSYERIADTTKSGVTAELPRLQGLMLPYTVTDRFGNWVKYTYTQNPITFAYSLKAITSSDGHTISFTYNTDGHISVVEDNTLNQGKQWKYTYSDGALTKVTLPDNSYWSIDFASLNKASWTYTNPTCTSLPAPTYPTGSSISSEAVSGTIQHPTGASGTFTFSVTRHGRNNAPASCLQNSVGTSFAAAQPAVFDILSLTKKAITGPNLSGALNWTIAYAGCSTSSCNSTKTTKVTEPRGFDTLYTFGALYSATAGSDDEGQLKSIQSGGTGGSYLQTETYTYFSNCGSSCPSTMGTPTQLRGDVAPLSTLKPIQTRTITRDGATYTQTSSDPDTYGFPQTITRTGTDTKTDTLTYHHDTDLWVLGMVVKQVSGGHPEFSITPYSNDLPQYVYRFGRLDKTYSYYDTGAVKTVQDGANKPTTYASYVAGVPQSVVYADSTSESAVVRYDGRLTSWTDADGNKTIYDYDAIGRLDRITYPPDSPTYSDRTITWTTPPTGWTRTEQVGSYSETTTYDALLRPVQTNENGTRYVKRTFDADGHTTFQSYPSSSAGSTDGITSTFDGIGRLRNQKDAAGYSVVYTPGANALTFEDRDSNSRWRRPTAARM